MSTGISEFYRPLTMAELDVFEADYEEAWKDPAMPERQYRRVVADELQRFRVGEDILPYRIALECLKGLNLKGRPTLLDVGASSGYYSEVFKAGGFDCDYTGCDYSEHFQRIARKLYPGIAFDVADARKLPYVTGSFDIVLHGACIMHIRDYQAAIAEAARVSKRFVIFHRTAIEQQRGTIWYAKEAYGSPCLEIHFGPVELEGLFERSGLHILRRAELFTTEDGYGHRTYVCEKTAPHHPV